MTSNAQALASSIFEWPLRVYIEDTDAGGIVYYVNYLKYMERARTEFMRSLGFDKRFIFNVDLMFVVHSVNVDYLKPARLDDELIATVEVQRVGKAYMLMAQKVYRVDESLQQENSHQHRELLCQGDVKLACVDRQTIKPKRLPEQVIVMLNGL